MDQLPLSVILPFRNNQDTLAWAILSILNQSFSNFELLLINDGSTDNSLAIARSFSDSRIQIIHNKKALGLSARLNQGIDQAKGRYIARMDGDDLAFPERFSQQIAYLDTHHDIDLLGTRAVTFNNHGQLTALLPFAKDEATLSQNQWSSLPLPHPTWMGRSEWFQKNRYQKASRAQDQELLLRALPTSCYACLPEILLAYRQGSYRLKTLWKTRLSLLSVSIPLFYERRQYHLITKTLLSNCLKLICDTVLSPLGRSFFYKLRSNNTPIPSETQNCWEENFIGKQDPKYGTCFPEKTNLTFRRKLT